MLHYRYLDIFSPTNWMLRTLRAQAQPNSVEVGTTGEEWGFSPATATCYFEPGIF